MNTTLTNSSLTATINPKGAELISLKSNASKREYIWEGDPDFWGKHSPVLFPIVGTLKNNQYVYQGNVYELPRHGFARDRQFELLSATQNQAIFSLKSDAESLKQYPFRFELRITYTLSANQLEIAYTVINEETHTMLFSIGAHPAFALPESFSSYKLAFEKEEKLCSFALENDLLSNHQSEVVMEQNVLPLSYALFEKDAMIFKQIKSRRIRLLENDRPLLHFDYADFPYFGIWTKTNAPFICLEPWLGYSDTVDATGNFAEKEAIQFLDPHQSFKCRFSIEIL